MSDMKEGKGIYHIVLLLQAIEEKKDLQMDVKIGGERGRERGSVEHIFFLHHVTLMDYEKKSLDFKPGLQQLHDLYLH
jgi:hypothetical protein